MHSSSYSSKIIKTPVDQKPLNKSYREKGNLVEKKDKQSFLF